MLKWFNIYDKNFPLLTKWGDFSEKNIISDHSLSILVFIF